MAETWDAILEEAVQACGGNQAELARLLERSPSVVGNWRMGRFKPDYESCLALAEITHRSPDEVLRAAGHDPRRLAVVRASGAEPPKSNADPDAVAIVAVWPSLEDGIQHAIRILAGLHPVNPSQQGGFSPTGHKQKGHKRGPNGGLRATLPRLGLGGLAFSYPR